MRGWSHNGWGAGPTGRVHVQVYVGDDVLCATHHPGTPTPSPDLPPPRALEGCNEWTGPHGGARPLHESRRYFGCSDPRIQRSLCRAPVHNAARRNSCWTSCGPAGPSGPGRPAGRPLDARARPPTGRPTTQTAAKTPPARGLVAHSPGPAGGGGGGVHLLPLVDRLPRADNVQNGRNHESRMLPD